MAPTAPALAMAAAALASTAARPCLAQAAHAPSSAPPPAPPPAERAHVYSPYEQQTIDEVLTSNGQVRDAEPEWKTIERVEIVPLDVFERRDLLPVWLNVFHATSRRSVIERELLVREGEPYRQTLVDDTIRNLRRLIQLSVVLVVATQGSAPDRVCIVVITKDVWSLRLNWDVNYTPGGLELFDAQPAEWNFLGTHQTLSGHFAYEPSAYTFGAGYAIPRIGTSRIALVASADVYVNRATGNTEGTAGSLVVGQPLYSALTPWAWDATVAWQDFIARRYVNAQLSVYADPATGQSVPFEYRSREVLTQYEVTRSYGWESKHDFTLAAEISHNVYRTDFAGADPRTVADFTARYVPVSDTRVGPVLRYHAYTQRFVRVIDFDTLALQEDYRLGHDLVVRVFPSFHGLGATRDVLDVYAAAQYTVALRDGLFRVSFQWRTENDPTGIADAALQPTMHLVSPTVMGIGRVVLDATLLDRWRNHLNLTDYLGGDTRLRGYPTNFFVGANVLTYNVELRSRPVEILSCQLAGVAFFDAGDAFRSIDTFTPYQGVGVGLRGLFPWLDRAVFRADLGIPLERPIDPSTGAAIGPISYFISFEQAFPTPTVSPRPVLPTGEE